MKLPVKVLDALREAARYYDVTPEEILNGSHAGHTSRARRRAIKTLHGAGARPWQIALWLGIHHTSVLYHLRQRTLEERRNDEREIPCPDLSGEWAI